MWAGPLDAGQHREENTMLAAGAEVWQSGTRGLPSKGPWTHIWAHAGTSCYFQKCRRSLGSWTLSVGGEQWWQCGFIIRQCFIVWKVLPLNIHALIFQDNHVERCYQCYAIHIEFGLRKFKWHSQVYIASECYGKTQSQACCLPKPLNITESLIQTGQRISPWELEQR